MEGGNEKQQISTCATAYWQSAELEGYLLFHSSANGVTEPLPRELLCKVDAQLQASQSQAVVDQGVTHALWLSLDGRCTFQSYHVHMPHAVRPHGVPLSNAEGPSEKAPQELR